MKLTREMIDAGKSEGGAWNAPQFALLGISWPPLHGWPARVIGNEISDADYAQFLALTGAKRKNKIGPSKRVPRDHADLFVSESPEDFANALFEKYGRDLG